MASEDTMSSEGAEPIAAEPGPRFGYQPALDGVRAVAVVLVLLVHGSTDVFPFLFPGGWLGVDIFFALSGYLITSLLLTEWARRGHVSFRDFYARRFLRLAPLSIAVVVAVWLVVYVAPAKSHLILSNRGAISILFYFSNFYYQRDIVALGSLLHCWSLSIEEQFYLLWPGLLMLVIRVGKQRWRAVAITLTTIIVLSQWVVRRQLWIADISSGRMPFLSFLSFYAGSFRRPDSIVLGCLLALVLFNKQPSRMAIRAIGVWAVAGLIVATLIVRAAAIRVATTSTAYFIPNWGLSVFNVSIIGILAWLVLQPASWAARLLATRPLIWIGRRAYGIYLLNPLTVPFLKYQTGWSWPLKTVLFLAFAFGAPAISYRWLEMPFLRRKARFSPLSDSGRRADAASAPTATIPTPVDEG